MGKGVKGEEGRSERGRRGRAAVAASWGWFGARLAFNGNIDVRVLGTNDPEKVRREVLRKLNAAKGGGYILQSDHSVPSDVDPATYDCVVELAREYGTYPLDLGEFDLDVR
ncbi:MAG TPA: uroporphyrinogen decarboxylase family protein [Sumerlaeia bacterium]|nr:uroporphyrinogen decarboxylase family protein [Sumerlaeia bacterium]